ncbi:hypothetical protein CXK86_11330 [Paenibacillus sp. BGI2013]|nr:hypothetical protein CXK86_11330 [Paenibacillus sp. BGI2013]
MIVTDEPDLTVRVTSALLKGMFSVDQKSTFELLKNFKGRVEGAPFNFLKGINFYLRTAVLESENVNFGKALRDLCSWSTDSKDPVVLYR